MVKVANQVPMLGYLRDIRLAGFKRVTVSQVKGQPVAEAREESLISEEECQARQKEAYERGQQEAQEQHKRQMEDMRRQWEEKHRSQTVALLDRLNHSVNQQLTETFRSLEKHLVMVAAEAAIKLTAGLPVSSDMVEAYVRESLQLVERETEVTVVLNPEDLALLEQHQSMLLNNAGSAPAVRFRADAKIGRGGCMLETKFGEIDARRETKIELLKRAVNE